jgi:hypothetical protein
MQYTTLTIPATLRRWAVCAQLGSWFRRSRLELDGDVLAAGIVKLLTWCGAVRIGRCGDCGDVQGLSISDRVIGQAGWLYHRFVLSLRDIEEVMVARGVVVTYETIRSWCATFGPDCANQ